jgi:hypothetical protein
VRFDWAAGRLVELGEREPRKQAVAARPLFLRDADRNLEGFLGSVGSAGLRRGRTSPRNAWRKGSGRCSPLSSAIANPWSINVRA